MTARAVHVTANEIRLTMAETQSRVDLWATYFERDVIHPLMRRMCARIWWRARLVRAAESTRFQLTHRKD